MDRYEPVDRSARLLPVVLSEQLLPGSVEFALDHLVDYELDLSPIDARICNDATGASAYTPTWPSPCANSAMPFAPVRHRRRQTAGQRQQGTQRHPDRTAAARPALDRRSDIGNTRKMNFNQPANTFDSSAIALEKRVPA